MKTKNLHDIANLLRVDSLKSTSKAGSGHPTSCLSCAEILSVLFFHTLKLDKKNPDNPNNDEFILSKGHAAPIFYASLYRAGLLFHHPNSLRNLKSPLEGHPIPSPHIPWIKFATGSLGQGLSVGVGMALASKLRKSKSKTYVLIGDSETAEGSIYEALQLASHYKLNNLVAIFDINRLGQTGPTMLQHDLQSYKNRISSFGWDVKIINGHSISDIYKSLSISSGKPLAILAKTIKGKGVSFLENKEDWHGKALTLEELGIALQEIPIQKMPKFKISSPPNSSINNKLKLPSITKYQDNEATRKAYGKALANLARSNQNILAIDGEVSNSTHAEEVRKIKPNQYIEAYIAEQNMLGMAFGLSKKGFNVFASTFAAFLTRAHDQLRMLALSKPNLTISGSHSGVSIGEDGASQMGLDDIAMFRTLPYSHIFYPSDPISTENLTQLAAKTHGLKYIRTTRPKTKLIYKSDEDFPLADFKILKSSPKDKVVLIGAGITLHECLKAHQEIKNTAVIDLYCIKPLKVQKLINFIKRHGNKAVIAEDHYPEGGIGEMLSAHFQNHNIKLKHLAINKIPHSGSKSQLLHKYKIDSEAIIKAVNDF